MGSYEDKYIQWTTQRQQRDQDVHELTNLFILYAQSWVLKIRREIWCLSTANIYIEKFRRKWSSLTLPHLAQHITMPPILSRNLSRRKEILDPKIRNQGKAPSNHRTRGKAKEGKLRKTPQIQIRTRGSGVNFITTPLIAQMSVSPNSHWWLN